MMNLAMMQSPLHKNRFKSDNSKNGNLMCIMRGHCKDIKKYMNCNSF